MSASEDQRSFEAEQLDSIPETMADGWIVHGDDLGGATKPRHVELLGSGEHLLIKSPSRCGNLRYLGNEYVAWRVAKRLGLPVLSAQVLSADGELHWGIRWTENRQQIIQAVLDACDNSDSIPAIMAFDLFIRNSDRHDANLFAQRSVKQPDRYRIVIFDHTHSLLDGHPPTDWWCAGKQFVRVPALKQWSPSNGVFDSILADIEKLTRADLKEYVASVPAEWYSDAEEEQIIQLLLQRKAKVRSWLAANFNLQLAKEEGDG